MKKTLLAGLACGVMAFGAVGVAESTEVLPMDLNSWTFITTGSNHQWESTSDGIKFYGSGVRTGSTIISNTVDDFTDATIYLKWMAHGAGYMGISPILADAAYTVGFGGNYTTHHDGVNGSLLIPDDTWLYTRFTTHKDTTYEFITSTGNYDTLGGAFLNNRSNLTDLSQSVWDSAFKTGVLSLSFGDNYGGTASYAILGEAKYVKSTDPVPEPATMLLFGTGLAGLAAARRRKKAC